MKYKKHKMQKKTSQNNSSSSCDDEQDNIDDSKSSNEYYPSTNNNKSQTDLSVSQSKLHNVSPSSSSNSYTELNCTYSTPTLPIVLQQPNPAPAYSSHAKSSNFTSSTSSKIAKSEDLSASSLKFQNILNSNNFTNTEFNPIYGSQFYNYNNTCIQASAKNEPSSYSTQYSYNLQNNNSNNSLLGYENKYFNSPGNALQKQSYYNCSTSYENFSFNQNNNPYYFPQGTTSSSIQTNNNNNNYISKYETSYLNDSSSLATSYYPNRTSAEYNNYKDTSVCNEAASLIYQKL